MGRPDIDLLHDAVRKAAQAARSLRALADGLEARVLRLCSGEREVELHPVSPRAFELLTLREHQRVELQVQLGWREAQGGRSDAFESTAK